MHPTRFYWLIPCCALLLTAADPVWKTTPISGWTEQDARLMLEHSPWSKIVVAGIARRQTEDERREGGNMGQPTGVGYDGVDEQKKVVLPDISGNPFSIDKTPQRQLPRIRLLVRW